MEQTWTASGYEQHGRFVTDLADDVFRLLNPQSGESILDLGCGDGVLTKKLQAAGAVVIGVDRSPELVSAARERGLDVRLGDGEQLTFDREFDAVFSNAALHWMKDQEAVLRGVRAALRPGGRFVAEMGGHGNIAAIRKALRAVLTPMGIDAEAFGANVFFTTAEYRTMLVDSGFKVEEIALIGRPTALPTGIANWLLTFRKSLLDSLSQERQTHVLEATAELLRPILCDRSGNWSADYVRLRFHATAT